jgi:hypothetical protein
LALFLSGQPHENVICLRKFQTTATHASDFALNRMKPQPAFLFTGLWGIDEICFNACDRGVILFVSASQRRQR